MTSLWWSLLGIVAGALLTFIVNLLTHRVNISQERALAQAERMTVQVEEMRYTVLTLTRDMAAAQTTLIELQHSMYQHQTRLAALEDKVGLFWHSIEEQLNEILRRRPRHEDPT